MTSIKPPARRSAPSTALAAASPVASAVGAPAAKLPTKSTDGTGALEKALDVLDAVGRAPQGLSQAELAQQLALPRTTVYRLLGSLTARGLVRRDPLRRVYGLGPRCIEYARASYTMPSLVAAASHELRALRDMTGETVYLATRDALDAVSLDRCDGAHSQRSNSAPGDRKPLHCTSQGKAMLAALPAAERDALVRDLPMLPVTPRSITDRRRLAVELKLTASRGWAMDDEEMVLGVRCCGAAVVDAAGQVRGAISVAGPAFRWTVERVQLLGPEVAEAARRVGAQLTVATPVQPSSEVRAVPGAWAFHGALPVWSDAAGGLYWADTLAPAVHLATAQGDHVVATLPAPVEQLQLHSQGVAVRCAGQWQLLQAPALLGTQTPPAKAVQATPLMRARPWAAAVSPRSAPLAVPLLSPPPLRHANVPQALLQTLPETLHGQAMAWHAGSQRLYVASASTGTLLVAQTGSDGLARLNRLATVPKGSGQLGGLAADAEGGLWCALRGGWSVVHFDASSVVDRVVAMPVPCPVDLALGGAAGTQLFITSSRETLGREALDAAPLSGRLFCLDLAPHGPSPA